MNKISKFFTLYWCIYFPTCIAYNDAVSWFSSIDEVMTGILVIYTFAMYNKGGINSRPKNEWHLFIFILLFYLVYGLLFGANVAGGVWLDFIQELRPYSIIFCTWILNPQFTEKQKKRMLTVMVATLASWIFYHPATTAALQTGVQAEFPVLGQLAICTGMSWYIFTKQNKKNRYIALALVLSGLLAPKMKFVGEVVCFVAMIFFIRKRLNFKSPNTIINLSIIMVVVLAFSWQRFDTYYVTGWSGTSQYGRMARPETYKASIQMLLDYFPLGSGMGSFACNGAWKYYSPLYYKYNLNTVWGLNQGGGFICDAYFPTLAQFGVVGIFFFLWFWKRRLVAFNKIHDLRYYRVAWITFFCLFIEQTSDSSWLSGKGMGYCMLIALCLNANRNLALEKARAEHKKERMEKVRKKSLIHIGLGFQGLDTKPEQSSDDDSSPSKNKETVK